MNRNVESHFSTVPHISVQRSTFDRGFSHKTTWNVGDLIPIFCDDVLPGDTMQVKTNKIVRLQTLLSPIYDNIYMDTYFFFVPTRLVWEHWKEFQGENTQSAWAPTREYQVPCISSPVGGFQKGTLADYFGLPIGVEWNQFAENAPIALPFRAYALICNEFFRDQNLSDPLLIPKDDVFQQGSNGSNYITDVVNGGKPFKVAKFHDYFTSALPAPQKGPAVSIPAGGKIPVLTGPEHSTLGESVDYNIYGNLMFAGGDPLREGKYLYTNTPTSGEALRVSNGSFSTGIAPSNQWAYGSVPGDFSTDATRYGLSISVNDLRLAVQTQRYYERLARGGSRYTEQILSFFGVRSPDARLQRPEYLGGNRIRLNVHEVTNVAQSELDFLGDLGAMSVTGDSHGDFIKSFTEHGYIIGVACCRYDHSYNQGINKMWLRKNKFDYYLPVFAHIGEQPIKFCEIYANQATIDPNVGDYDTFGYQEAWADYRYKPNYVTGSFRAGQSGNLSHWTLTDNYSDLPILSDGWIREDENNLNRALAVTSAVEHQFFADFYFDYKCTRPMPMYSVPGLVDHF